MAVTYREAPTARSGVLKNIKSWRWTELIFLLSTSIVVGMGLFLVYQAKTTRPLYDPKLTQAENLPAILADDPDKIVFGSFSELLEGQKLFNLNRIRQPDDILPALSPIGNEVERLFIAREIVDIVRKQGALSSVRMLSAGDLNHSRGEIDQDVNLVQLRQYLDKIRESEAIASGIGQGDREVAVNDGETKINVIRPFSGNLRPLTVVRTPGEFNRSLLVSVAIFYLVFFATHLLWSFFGMSNSQILLPAVQLLCGLGFILMITIHDPLRDSLVFAEFVAGIAYGAILLVIFSFIERIIRRPLLTRIIRPLGLPSGNFMQIFEGWGKYAVLGIALILSVLLLTLGKGPGGTKVNLGPVQPSEFIKLLVVLFLAAYFAAKGVFLESLRSHMTTLIRFPRLGDILPVVLAIAIVFAFFYFQKDFGPALIIILSFLVLYATARKKAALASAGLAAFISLLVLNYFYVYSPTVFNRIRIFLNIWENGLSNGDQIARGWWALSSGGFWGTGLGLGDPSETTIPAGHTDLVLASIGEEIGFIGIAVILILYLVIILKGLQISSRARRDSGAFLALGLTMLIGLEVVLIVSGVLGLFPLTGVVNPFLSFGKSSMIANFIVIGLLASISNDSVGSGSRPGFQKPVRLLTAGFTIVFAGLALQAFRIQYWNGDENVAKAILTRQADGGYRYLYNTRLEEVARLLPKGTIFDRNGVPLATSDCKTLEDRKNMLASIGFAVQEECTNGERRYPIYRRGGLSLFHLIGDARLTLTDRTGNDFIEKTEKLTLQGFDDKPKNLSPEDKIRTVNEYDEKTGQWGTRELRVQPRDLSELVPLLRYRHFTWQPELRVLWNRKRDINTTIDVRLQLALAGIVERQVREKRLQKAAAVVIDPASGDILAMVSYPWFSEEQLKEFVTNPPDLTQPENSANVQLQDRARNEANFPGSTFKIVTAIAALRTDPGIAGKTYSCERLADGRAGIAKVPGYGRVRDDEDDQKHDSVDLNKGIIKSCNAYFAQLAVLSVKENALWDTARLLGIQFTEKPVVKLYNSKSELVDVNFQMELHNFLPQASYGQYPVKATPLQMSQVAAAIANNGTMVPGHLLLNTGSGESVPLIDPVSAGIIAAAMRGVVTSGTGVKIASLPVPVAGKTGTAEVPNQHSHSWFIGYAPYGGRRPLAFALFFENGGYGSTVAVPAAGEIVMEASRLGLF